MVFRTAHIVFSVVCFFVFSLSALSVHASDDSVFKIEGVEVDVTADSAAQAREQAFAQAQVEAFTRLASRLLSESQFQNFAAPEVSVISALVKDFEVTQERLSAVRYIGNYTFRFQNDAVRNYLGSRGLVYTDVGSKPVLILPFYQWGAKNILWDEGNPWMKAWSANRLAGGLVPVIIPIGDLQDVSDIGEDEALTYDPANLVAMKDRYGAGEAIIMLASPSWINQRGPSQGQPPDGLTIMLYRTDTGVPAFTNRFSISKDDVVLGEDIYTAGVRISREALQNEWKNQTLTSAGQANSIKVRVKFNQMQEWVETQKKLRRVQGVDDMKLVSLKQGEANVELMFQGTESRLRLALSQADMTLGAPSNDYSAPRNTYQDPYGRDPYGRNNYNNQRRSGPSLVYDLYLNKYAPQEMYR